MSFSFPGQPVWMNAAAPTRLPRGQVSDVARAGARKKTGGSCAALTAKIFDRNGLKLGANVGGTARGSEAA